jgi:hypothetical protein
MNNIKVNLLGYGAMSVQSMIQLLEWMKLSRTPIAINNPRLRVAQAVDAFGETICYVLYTKADNAFLVTGFANNPGATTQELYSGLDCIDLELQREAQKANVSRLLLMQPNRNECDEIRTYSRKHIPQSVAMVGVGNTTQSVYIN